MDSLLKKNEKFLFFRIYIKSLVEWNSHDKDSYILFCDNPMLSCSFHPITYGTKYSNNKNN